MFISLAHNWTFLYILLVDTFTVTLITHSHKIEKQLLIKSRWHTNTHREFGILEIPKKYSPLQNEN